MGLNELFWRSIPINQGWISLEFFHYFSSKSSFVSRFLENISFGISSSIYILLMKEKPSIIFLNTWPVFATFLNIFIASILGIPVVRSIQDIYPESLGSQKRINEKGLIFRALSLIEKYNYKNSKTNITISKKMGEVLISKNPMLDKPEIIPNWHTLHNQLKDNLKRESINIKLKKDDTIFIYGGNISKASNIIGLINAFKTFSVNRPNVKLLIAGSGPMLDDCKKIVHESNADDRIFFHSPWKIEATIPLFKIADILVLPTDNEQAKYSVPSKIISYMKASKPILAFGSSNSELESCIIDSGCGWFYNGLNEKHFISGLEGAIKSNFLEREEMGAKGHEYMMNNFDKDTNVRKIVDQIFKFSDG